MLKKDEQVIEMFLNHIKRMDGAEKTVSSYRTTLHQFFTKYQDFEKIERSQINEFRDSLIEKGYETSSVRQKISAIGSFYSYVVDEKELLKMTPVYKIKLPKIQATMRILPKQSEIDNEIKQLREEGFDNLSMALLIGSRVALRIGEVLSLNIEDIDYNEGIFHLHKTKTTNYRPVAVDKKTLAEIKEYCKRNHLTRGRLLRNKSMEPLTNSWAHKLIKDHCSHHFHLNRHFCLTKMIEEIGLLEASIQAGHSTTRTTEKTYYHADIKNQKAVMDNMWK